MAEHQQLYANRLGTKEWLIGVDPSASTTLVARLPRAGRLRETGVAGSPSQPCAPRAYSVPVTNGDLPVTEPVRDGHIEGMTDAAR